MPAPPRVERDGRGADGTGRLSAAAIAVGIAQAALEHAVRYAAEREQFGRADPQLRGHPGKAGGDGDAHRRRVPHRAAATRRTT
jgi:alkylation response protein AidB-like acyl-CoA dehydrogenase